MAKTVVVIGTEWGDEGKGKITDYLATRADVVVRSQGGNNAGHSIFFAQKKFALHLIPSGIFNPKIMNIMAGGMVINPKALAKEIDNLIKQEITDFQLYISDRAHVVMPYHLELDRLYESLKNENALGTTKNGIGPAYADKATRLGIRFGDLIHKDSLFRQVNNALAFYNPVFETFGKNTFSPEQITEEYYIYGQMFEKYITDTSILLDKAIKADKYVLFEGAQGTMLCLDHGTYPFVTSSSPTAAGVPLAAGIAPQYIKEVVGVTKAYSTRVGAGVFPTEFEDEITKYIREKGHEYGTTTGRARRIGWLDMNVIRHAVRINGLTGLAVTLVDVLSEIKELKICIAYELDGKIIDYIPGNYDEYKRCKPIYDSFPGWDEDITQIKNFEALPENCINYLKAIEMLSGTKITVLSLGPDREQTVILHNYF